MKLLKVVVVLLALIGLARQYSDYMQTPAAPVKPGMLQTRLETIDQLLVRR